MTERDVHPAAAVFPMLADDELRELADDIKANGLRHAITLDMDGRIVDGRNRDAACRLAGVEPRYETLNGDCDPVAVIISENVRRRQMSKGQTAMAVVRACKFSLQSTTRSLGEIAGSSHQTVHQAYVVQGYAPDLAELVLSGGMFLTEAYVKARARKVDQETQAESDARALAETNTKTARLRADAPDLAELVAEWRMSLEDATAALDDRQRRDHERKQRATVGFAKATSYLYALLQTEPEQIARDWTPAENTLAGVAGCEALWTSAGLAELAAWLGRAATAWEDGRR